MISQDPLGLDWIYVRAKRYAVDRTVGRPWIHVSAGALLGEQGYREAFITPSSFTRGAQEEAERINARIELIDGTVLAELQVQYESASRPSSRWCCTGSTRTSSTDTGR